MGSTNAAGWARYLINFSYIGSPFRGSQRQVTRRIANLDDPSTVQGRLEMGLKRLRPVNNPIVFMASRTDAGVHALNTTCHVDLQSCNNMIFEPQNITLCLNRYFTKEELPIRVLSTKLVLNDFHCKKSAISRTYLYRVILLKYDEDITTTLLRFLPIEEFKRCHFYGAKTIDIDLMRESAKLFEGVHDFRTFKSKSNDEPKSTVKEIERIDIIEKRMTDIGISADFSWPRNALQNVDSNTYTFLDIYFKGKGFLYKQVRRCGAAILAAGTGIVDLKDIRCMLQVPSVNSWNPRIRTLPPHGLYLCNIEY
ncbi:hypothetical protein GWI33_013407 [Rhynchophorus ferrugineus]|uniref:tRNA pseudouridine synthase n=1 Tax=Rhynchophorus ferrugineus TaxID=354439 RepID=A0A834I738_RHYFE|nr:hypothetical protein GWI33_013407 [Rhynchophorus ferrugineus]